MVLPQICYSSIETTTNEYFQSMPAHAGIEKQCSCDGLVKASNRTDKSSVNPVQGGEVDNKYQSKKQLDYLRRPPQFLALRENHSVSDHVCPHLDSHPQHKPSIVDASTSTNYGLSHMAKKQSKKQSEVVFLKPIAILQSRTLFSC